MHRPAYVNYFRQQPKFDLFTVAEAADLAKVHEITIRREIECGALPARKIAGGVVRISREDLEKWLTGRQM